MDKLISKMEFLEDYYKGNGLLVKTILLSPEYMVIWEGTREEAHVWMLSASGRIGVPQGRPIDLHKDTASVAHGMKTENDFVTFAKEWVD